MKTSEAGTISTGNLKASFGSASTATSDWRQGAQGNFGIAFQNASTGAPLTKLGWRGLGYVTDSRDRSKKEKKYTTTQLELQVGEKIYGFGERFGPLVKNGQRLEIWHKDSGTGTNDA